MKIIKQDYSNIVNPYNNELIRESSIITNKNGIPLNSEAQNVINTSQKQLAGQVPLPSGSIQGESFENLWINSWIKSTNYLPKKRGFYIDGIRGYIEIMNLYAQNATISGTITASQIDIPNATSLNSFHVDSSGNSWWGTSVAQFNLLNSNANFKYRSC